MDITVAKIKVTKENIQSLLFKDILIPVFEHGKEDCKLLPDAELQNVEIKEINDSNRRSILQLNTYWASCKEVANNTEDENWNTQKKVDEQTKIKARLVDYYIYYLNEKTGEQTLNIKTKSIAFKNLKHLEACGFFDEAFQIHADSKKLSVDEWIMEVKSRMGA